MMLLFSLSSAAAGELTQGQSQALSDLRLSSEKLIITDRDCRQLAQYVPSQKVNYVPGEDVYGNPVAPANLEASYASYTPPRSLRYDLRVLLEEDLPLSPEGSVGFVDVDLNTGLISANGVPVDNGVWAEFLTHCSARNTP